MPLVRWLARRRPLHSILYPRNSLPTHSIRTFSHTLLSLARKQTRATKSQHGSTINYLEQDSSGGIQDYTNTETETAQLKARIRQIEAELRAYEQKEGLRHGSNLAEKFGDIIKEMPEELRPDVISHEELQGLVDRNDPRMYDYIEEEDLEEKEQVVGYDVDAVAELLPEDMRAKLTREEIQGLVDAEDERVMEIIRKAQEEEQEDGEGISVDKLLSQLPEGFKEEHTVDEIVEMARNRNPRVMEWLPPDDPAPENIDYDVGKSYANLPEHMRQDISEDQLVTMIERQDSSIQEYLVPAVERAYDLDATYEALPADLRRNFSKEKVRAMMENQDPAIEQYLVEYNEENEKTMDTTVNPPYDVEEVFKLLPKDVQAKLSKEQVQKMIETREASVQKYLNQIDEQKLEERFRQEMFGNPNDGKLHVDVPDHSKIHLDGFNRVMKDVASQSRNPKSIPLLWAKYELCKQNVPGFLENIPPPVWKVLWLSQWKGNLVHESRKQHLWTMVNDMIDNDQDLDHDQKLIYIEYEFSEGSKNKAMKIWRREFTELKDSDPMRDSYRDLGVRLHVEAGLLAEAQSLIFGKNRQATPRAEDVAVLVAAWVGKSDERSLKVAWALYLDMRERIGTKIKPEDYDQIAMTFLGAGKPNLALAVFKDMVLSDASKSKASKIEDTSLATPLLHLQNRAVTKEELEKVSLTTLATIPKRFENKYFYASWIKRLIGLGEVDETVQVLELMFQRGIRPDAKHINGIIGAWLRGQDHEKYQLALQIGWTMITERLKYVSRRNNAIAGVPNLSVDHGRIVPSFISKNLPSANIETFCVLLLYYTRRGMEPSVRILKERLAEAEIAPNSYFMNHLMFAELRKENVREAWILYRTMSHQVIPDLETFSALWHCEKIFTSGRSGKVPGLPRSRLMFKRMTEWYTKLEGRSLKSAQETFGKEMYNEIIRCFCIQKDIEGTIVALYGLRDMFGAFPNPETERMILIQLARMGEGTVLRHKRRRARHRFSANEDSVQDFNKITKIAQLVKDERVHELSQVGIEDSSLKGRERKEEDLYRIVQILRTSLRHQAGVDLQEISPQELHLGLVAEEMGHSSLNMEVPTYGDGKAPV